MNRRKGLILIAASTVAGVVCSAGIYSAVAANRDDPVKKADTVKTTPVTKPSATKTTPTPKPSTPPTTPVKSAVMSIDNLVETSVLTSLGYPVDLKSANRYDGDLQYVVTPCVKESMDGLSALNVFSGTWPMTDGGIVSESITAGDTQPIADTLANTIVGWHTKGCGASSGASEWTVGPHHRTKVSGGWTDWVELRGTGDTAGQVDHAAVIEVDDRVAILGVSTSGHSEPVFLKLLDKAVDALR